MYKRLKKLLLMWMDAWIVVDGQYGIAFDPWVSRTINRKSPDDWLARTYVGEHFSFPPIPYWVTRLLSSNC